MLGVLMLETRFPRIPGDVGNPETFPFPVRYRVVKGATPRRVVAEGDPALLEPFIAAGLELIREGARLITTSCGFLALFHRELAAALPVPVLTSSLLQVAPVYATLQPGQRVGILTTSRSALTPRHLEAVGAGAVPVAVMGLEETAEFARAFLGDAETFDAAQVEAEVVAAARRLVADHPDVGALVLECTNLPPYAQAIRRTTGMPVYDITTLCRWAWAGLVGGGQDGR